MSLLNMLMNINIESTSLYLAIAQIIAALTGLFAIFVFQRINQIRDIIIGDGKSHLRREKIDHKEKRYRKINSLIEKENKFGLKRLEDAIDRKNLYGIKEAIYKCDYRELKGSNFFLQNRIEGNREEYDLTYMKGAVHVKNTGYFHNVRPRFDKSLKQLLSLKKILLGSILFLFLLILFIFYALFDYNLFSCSKTILFYSTLFLTLLIITVIVYLSLFRKMPHEKEKRKECIRIDKLLKQEIPVGLKRECPYDN
ncbi:MAG: hypothetical protein KQH79_04185 [Bacteroidetes bacterium]|nr:hypothetical protein [Bacteroidota bacterium]